MREGIQEDNEEAEESIDNDYDFELRVQATIAENSDVVKLPPRFRCVGRCGGARTQGLSYEEPATKTKELDKEDQRPSEESSLKSNPTTFEGIGEFTSLRHLHPLFLVFSSRFTLRLCATLCATTDLIHDLTCYGTPYFFHLCAGQICAFWVNSS